MRIIIEYGCFSPEVLSCVLRELLVTAEIKIKLYLTESKIQTCYQ